MAGQRGSRYDAAERLSIFDPILKEARRVAAVGRALAAAKPGEGLPAGELAYWRQLAESTAVQAEIHWLAKKHTAATIDLRAVTTLRDPQMAKNLAWLAREAYPKRKLIIWAASLHVARNPPTIQRLDNYKPADHYREMPTMGGAAWKVLGKESYTLAFIAAEGEAGNPFGKP